MEEIIGRFLDSQQIDYDRNASLADRTWIHRGSVVPFLIYPHNPKELVDVVGVLNGCNAVFKVIGYTSNLYFKPSFVADAIVSTRKMTSFHREDGLIICDAGVNVSRLSKYAVENGFLGFEGLIGLPGTIGAAVVNNSSCFNCSVSELVESVDVLENGEIKTLYQESLGFKHRSSSIKRGEIKAIIIKIRLIVRVTDDIEGLKRQAQHNEDLRRITQERKVQNLGSVFSNYHPRVINVSTLGWKKAFGVLLFRIREHFFRNNETYKQKRISHILNLYGYNDISKYVSKKNINCFIWKDEGADKVFDRYVEFMNRYADCDALEIEILQ